MNGLAKLGELWHSVQTWLFPGLEDELGKLDEKHREFVAVCETCAPRIMPVPCLDFLAGHGRVVTCGFTRGWCLLNLPV